MKQPYDPSKVIVLVSGVPVEGYGTDTFIECSRTEDTNTLVVGNSGTGRFNINPNRSGSIKLTLMQSSDSVSVLSLLSLPTVPPFPVLVTDNTMLGAKAIGVNCMIKKVPDLVRAKEEGNVDIEITAEKLLMFGA